MCIAGFWLGTYALKGAFKGAIALQITFKNPDDLKPRARNPRTHSPKQVKQIAASIEKSASSTRF
jgi:hypothetical protein